MIKRLAYRIVFNDLKKCNLFRGIYDAKNGNKHFMYGVSCVMEAIAAHGSNKVFNEFCDEFTKNMIESEKKC